MHLFELSDINILFITFSVAWRWFLGLYLVSCDRNAVYNIADRKNLVIFRANTFKPKKALIKADNTSVAFIAS